MRKRLTLATALAVGAAVAVAGVAAAVQSPTLTGADGNTQSMGVNLKPKKLSKTRPTPTTLEVNTATDNATTANGVPIPAVRAVIDFPKGLTIYTKGYPRCNSAKLQNTSTEKALEECKRAKVGGGQGTLDLVVGERVFPVVAAMTIFNGVPQGKKPVILLHLFSQTPIQTTVVLVGVVKRYNKQGFGTRLDVAIPLLAGGQGAVTGVKIKVFKRYFYKGQKRSFINSTCPTKTWKARGKFVFLDGEALTPKVRGKCRQKK